jgi:hypothetical protein
MHSYRNYSVNVGFGMIMMLLKSLAMLKILQKRIISLLLSLSPLIFTPLPLQAAEEVLFSYGTLIVAVLPIPQHQRSSDKL